MRIESSVLINKSYEFSCCANCRQLYLLFAHMCQSIFNLLKSIRYSNLMWTIANCSEIWTYCFGKKIIPLRIEPKQLRKNWLHYMFRMYATLPSGQVCLWCHTSVLEQSWFYIKSLHLCSVASELVGMIRWFSCTCGWPLEAQHLWRRYESLTRLSPVWPSAGACSHSPLPLRAASPESPAHATSAPRRTKQKKWR